MVFPTGRLRQTGYFPHDLPEDVDTVLSAQGITGVCQDLSGCRLVEL